MQPRRLILSTALPAVLLTTACGPLPSDAPENAVAHSSQGLGAQTAVYDTTLRVPACASPGSSCGSGTLLNGRANLGPEPHQPNTLQGTCADGTSGSYHGDESLDELRVLTEDGTDLQPGKRVRIEARVWAYSSYSSDKLDLYAAADARSPSWTFLGTLTPTGSGSQLLSTTYTLPNGTLQAIRGVFRYGGSAASCGTGSYTDNDDLVFATAVVVPDSTPPSTSLTAPTAGGTVYGHQSVEATASDNVGVARVEFYLDGTTLLGTDTSAPYLVLWNTRNSPEGMHTLTSKAFDAAGNATTSAGVTVTVARDTVAPTVTCTAPAEGSTVTGIVNLEATASDDIAVQRVDFYDGSTFLGSDTTAPYSLAWDTRTSLQQGGRTLYCRAWDLAQNIGEDTLAITTANPETVSYDVILKAPRCTLGASSCDTRNLLVGKGDDGPEPHYPNTVESSCADGMYGTYQYSQSIERLVLSTLDGAPLAEGKTVRVDATVWAKTNSTTGYADNRLDLYIAPDYRSPVWTYLTTLTPTAGGAQTLSTTFVLPVGDIQVLRANFRDSYEALSPCTWGDFIDHDDLLVAVLPATPDAVPPQVSLTAPATGAVLSGSTPLTASASDDVRLSRVEFYAGTTQLVSLDRPPFTMSWNTRTVANGPVTLSAKAYDSSGNSSTSSVDVVVDNDYEYPTVAISSPSADAQVSGQLTVKVVTSDNKAVTRVQFYGDSVLLGESTTPPFDFTFDTLMLDSGYRYLKARAYDAAGNATSSSELRVNVYNPGNVAWDPVLKVPACNYEHSYCNSEDLLFGMSSSESNTPNTLNGGCVDSAWDPYSAPYVSSLRIQSLDYGPLTRGKTARLEVTYYMPWNYSSYVVDVYYTANITYPSWTKLTSWTPFQQGTTWPIHDFTLPSTGSTRMAIRAVTRPTSTTGSSCTSGDQVDHDDLVFRVK